VALERRLGKVFGDDEPTAIGTGWASGILSVFLGALAVGAVLCLHFPALLTAPELRALYPMTVIRGLIQAGIVVGFASGLLSTWLRRQKTLGLTGMLLALVATLLGGADVPVATPVPRQPHLGLDWFLLSLFLWALLFVPLERLAPLHPEHGPFRRGWTTDLGWFFTSHVTVQALSLIIMWPAVALAPRLAIPALQAAVATLPVAAQFVAILVVADLTQYGLHRAFHEVPLLWRFHRVHHSSTIIDWLAGSRLHLLDVVVTRGLVLLPIAVLGFAPSAVYAYLTFVSLHAVFIHANFRPRAGWLERCVVMPHFHHWHHADESEAVNRNYAVHLPWIDRLFGTAWEPARWPRSYGLADGSAPAGVLAQLAWPFRASPNAADSSAERRTP
jgi:sterol desaturase/sphingolipid hydroxylase (fatty acid hydroxylase superfamily)